MENNNHHIYGKIRKHILVSMIFLPAVSLTLILGIGYFYFTTALTSSGMASVKRIVRDHRLMIESFLLERRADLEFVQEEYAFMELTRIDVLSRVFGQLQRVSTAFADLGVFDAHGFHIAYCGPYQLSGMVYNDAEWFKEVIKNGYYISDVFLGYRKIPHFIIAVAREENGRKWVIRATIDTRMFNDLVGKVRIGKSGEAYILTRNGLFQTERRSGGYLMEKDPDFPDYPKLSDGAQTFFHTDLNGEPYLYAMASLKLKDWMLVVRQEKSDAFESLRTATWLIFLAGGVGGTAITGVSFYLTGRIVDRIKEAETAKDRMRDQLIRAGRLAELGEMAAGFAHEINNPLQIMKSEQALIETILYELKNQAALGESEDFRELSDSLSQVALQIDRCDKITHAILKFGRKTDPEYIRISLVRFFPEIIAMVDKQAEIHGVDLVQDIAPNTPPVFGDPTQLQQVILNLLNNALDAVIQRHGSAGGELRLSAGPQGKDTVEIRVSDNGSGIRPENLKKVFSPFFTTKPVGQGTGLGLSICYGIIRSMEGTMVAVSEPGEGATFTIRLPVAETRSGAPNEA